MRTRSFPLGLSTRTRSTDINFLCGTVGGPIWNREQTDGFRSVYVLILFPLRRDRYTRSVMKPKFQSSSESDETRTRGLQRDRLAL